MTVNDIGAEILDDFKAIAESFGYTLSYLSSHPSIVQELVQLIAPLSDQDYNISTILTTIPDIQLSDDQLARLRIDAPVVISDEQFVILTQDEIPYSIPETLLTIPADPTTTMTSTLHDIQHIQRQQHKAVQKIVVQQIMAKVHASPPKI